MQKQTQVLEQIKSNKNLKIGIHNIIPAFGYILYTTLCIFLAITLFDRFDAEAPGTIILWLILILACYTMLGLMSYNLKFIWMTDEKMTVLRPLRFQFEIIEFKDIITIDWNIWSAPKLGDYRNLTIKTNNFKTNFSDFEFINFNSLERFILDKTQVSSQFNLKIKRNVELAQARENRWWNLAVILMLFIFLVLVSLNGETGWQKLIIQTVIIVVIIRLVVVFIEYQKRINDAG
jgi:hypothetical protein